MPNWNRPPVPPDRPAADDTHARLLETAGRVFAESGFQAAKVRDICKRAGVNIAAVNYHFGDKLGLYEQVLRYAACAAGNVTEFDPRLPGRTPQEKLYAFVRGMLQSMYGEDRPAWPVRLMTHELAQPTPLLAGVVEQMIRPRYNAVRALVGGVIGLPPDHRWTRFCAHSIMGQVILYAHGREVLNRLWPELKFTPETLDEIAGHIATFSYAALQNFARGGARQRRAAAHARQIVRAAHVRLGRKPK